LFERDGKLFRPSQFISKIYGYGFDLNEVLQLSDKDYAEKEAVSVRPHWGEKILATHTYSTAGQLTIIDAFTYRIK
jgi:hypothetical protein